MKLPAQAFTLAAGAAGLAALTALVAHEGYATILQTLERAGWGLWWIVPFHALPLALDVEGWRALLSPRDPLGHATRLFLLWIATVREAVSRLLPVASIGGEIVGVRLVLLRPLNGAAVAASVIVEVLLTLVTQILFTAIGLALLLAIVKQTPLLETLLGGLAASAAIPVALALLLRYGSPFTRLALLSSACSASATGSRRSSAAPRRSMGKFSCFAGVTGPCGRPWLGSSRAWSSALSRLGSCSTYLASP
jgi:hypothetical protein